MELPEYRPDRRAGYDIENIIAVTVARAGCCAHGVSLLAPCEPCQRVDVFEGDYWNDVHKRWIGEDYGGP